MSRNSSQPVSGLVPFAVLLASVALVNGYLVLHGVEFVDKSLQIKAYFLTTAVALLVLPLIVLPAGTYALLLAFGGIFAPFEFLHIHIYRSASTVGAIGSTLETNPGELIEFLAGKGQYLGAATAFLGVIVVLAIRARAARLPPRATRLGVLALVAVIVAVGLLQKSIREGLGIRRAVSEVSGNLQRSFRISYPYGFWTKFAVAGNGVWQAARHHDATSGFRFNARRDTASVPAEVYVTVLGETQRFANWSIHGYDRETSPRLSRVAGLTSFARVCSASNVSRMSVPIILTRVGATRYREVYKERSFMAAFAEVGFRTYWISNQGRFGRHDNSISMHSGDAAEAFFLGRDRTGDGFDLEILPVLEEVLGRNEARVKILIHTQGSHYAYSARYPREAALFLPDLAPEWGDKEALVNSYDNSIAYADRVISAIIDLVDSKNVPAVVAFISDHGENLGDDERGLWGHPTASNTIHEYHVPLFVWLSEAYRNAHPVKAAAIAANQGRWATGSSYFHTITDLASISCDGCQIERSLASSAYRESDLTVVDANGRLLDCRQLK